MSHVFFFSYARENGDKELRAFFEDLCGEVAPYTEWSADDPRISFRDGRDLPLMDEWKPWLVDALQSSAVLVCVTSPAYFQRVFCGQEYRAFDQRRRKGLQPGDPAPGVILPVIWAPVTDGLPTFMDKVQWQQDFPDVYHRKGLRYLRKLDPGAYDKCVLAFADAIQQAWKMFGTIPRLPGLALDQTPNAFGGGQWEEAADSNGWLPGPGVANFVFAAARAGELAIPPGRYGTSAAEWRPYLPPVPRTIADIAKSAAKKHSLRYREIIVNRTLAAELQGARARKNLTLVLADAQTLPIADYHGVSAFDVQTWEGSALLVPWDDVAAPWQQVAVHVATSFPIMSQLKPPAFRAPIATADDLDKLLDITLTDLRALLTRAETEKKPKTDVAPAQIVGSGEVAP